MNSGHLTKQALCGLFLTAALAATVTACGKMQERKKLKGLNDTVQSYIASLRWGHFQNTLAFHLTQDGERSAQVPAGHEEFEVTGVHILHVLSDIEQQEAAVEIDIEYVRHDTATVDNRKFEQFWWYNKAARRWFNESDFPAFWKPEPAAPPAPPPPSEDSSGGR